MVQCYWWDNRDKIKTKFNQGGTHFNSYKMIHEVCVLGWWRELKMRRGDFKEVRFVIMLLDKLNIEGGGSRKRLVWLWCRVCVGRGEAQADKYHLCDCVVWVEGVSFSFCGFVEHSITSSLESDSQLKPRIIDRRGGLSYRWTFSFLEILLSFLEIIDSFRWIRCDKRKIIDRYAEVCTK